MKDTLMAIKKHSVTNVLDEIGKADITYHLNLLLTTYLVELVINLNDWTSGLSFYLKSLQEVDKRKFLLIFWPFISRQTFKLIRNIRMS